MEELPQEDTLIMNLGPAKPAPIVAMPCSCSKPEECCVEARMLALQDILEDEKRVGPDFISFASSTNAEVTREIRDTAHLISRFDKEKEQKIKAHRAAINKIWWIPYHRRPDHPTPYHKNSQHLSRARRNSTLKHQSSTHLKNGNGLTRGKEPKKCARALHE